MTLGELVKNKNYDYIEYRVLWENDKICDGIQDDFTGACKAENGEIIPLDGDYYSPNMEIKKYEEWKNDDGKPCLTVWELVDMLTGAELDAYLEQERIAKQK